jgi:signal transduction histidine kinase
MALCTAGEYELAGHVTYADRPVWPGPHPVNAVVIPLLTLPLVWRRRYPLPVCLLVLSGITITSATLGGGEATAEFLLFLAVIFSAAAYTGRPVVVLVSGLVAGTVHEVNDPAVHGLGDGVWTLGMLAIAFLLGRAVHGRQHRIHALQQEAEQRERDHAQQVATATAAERAAIARELHDIVAHAVSVVVIQAQAGARALPHQPEVATTIFDTIENSARTALTDLRRLLTLLADADADADAEDGAGDRHPAGSFAQLDALVTSFRASGVDVRLTAPQPLPQIGAVAELAAYRVVQEALTNAIRYAHGSTVTVDLSADIDELRICVSDRGGETAQAISGLGTGRGLIGMRQRLELVGGRLLQAGRDGDGFRVRAVIPLRDGARAVRQQEVLP